MIKSITLNNFCGHKKLKVVLDPNITTIVGKSYAGKSTVIRALKWVCLNEPAGTGVINWDAKQTKVVLNCKGGRVTKVRGKTLNQYFLKTREGTQKYTAFGNKVPPAIQTLVNVSSDNFQGQHALPFWFGESAGKVAKKINKIVDLSVIDSTLSNLASMQTKAKTVVTVTKERITSLKKQQKELRYVERIEKNWRKILKKQRILLKIDDTIEEMQELLETWEEHETTIKKTKPPSLSNAAAIYGKLRQTDEDFSSLQHYATTIEDLMTKVADAKDVLREKRIIFDKLSIGRCPLCGKQK